MHRQKSNRSNTDMPFSMKPRANTIVAYDEEQEKLERPSLTIEL